jgi:hypothetical protein
MLTEEREGIAFQDNVVEAVADLVFVVCPFTDSGNKDFPDPRFDALSHRMGAAIPAIKIPHHAHPLGIGRPNGKAHALMLIDFREVRTEFFVDLIVVALTIQVSVQFT